MDDNLLINFSNSELLTELLRREDISEAFSTPQIVARKYNLLTVELINFFIDNAEHEFSINDIRDYLQYHLNTNGNKIQILSIINKKISGKVLIKNKDTKDARRKIFIKTRA